MNHNGGDNFMSANESLQHSASLNGNGAPQQDRPAESRKAASGSSMQMRAYDRSWTPLIKYGTISTAWTSNFLP